MYRLRPWTMSLLRNVRHSGDRELPQDLPSRRTRPERRQTYTQSLGLRHCGVTKGADKGVAKQKAFIIEFQSKIVRAHLFAELCQL